MGFEFCKIPLSCNLKLLPSHYLSPRPTYFPYSPTSVSSLWENPDDFYVLVWLLLGNFVLILETACITQPQVSSSIYITSWLKNVSSPALQQTEVCPIFLFFLVFTDYLYKEDNKLCMCALHDNEQCRGS